MTDAVPTVDDYMAVDVTTFQPSTDIHTALRVLVEQGISGAPVTGSNEQLVGMLTEKDCLKVVYSASYHQDWGGTVADYMSTGVEVMESGTSIIDAADRFMKCDFRRFPVVQSDRMIGLICRSDVLRAIQELWPMGSATVTSSPLLRPAR